jgi:Fe2+ or Zn2+ uptake regulation protein
MSKHPSRPPWPEALERIRRSDLTGAPYRTLRAMIEWWNADTGLLWPSIGVIAEGARLDRGTVRRALRQLEAAGVVEYAKRSSGRKAHVFRLHLDRLNPCAARGSRNDPDPRATHRSAVCNACATSVHPAASAQETRAQRTSNPGAAHEKPSIHPQGKEQINHGASSSAPGNGWMEQPPDGQRGGDETAALRAALAANGVKGAMLDRLSSCGRLTAAEVCREAADVRRDPGVRNLTAVLVPRLARLAGIEMRQGPRLDANQRAAIGRIEHLKRHRGPSGSDHAAGLSPGYVRQAAGLDSPETPTCGTLNGEGS